MSPDLVPPDPALPPPGAPAPDFAERLRALRNDHRNVALPGLIATWLGIGALLAAPAWLGVAHLVWITPVMGVLLYRLVISGHEAVHHTLVWPRPLNEAFGVLGQALVGVNFTAYRLQHLDHHKVRDRAQDPDGYIYGWVIETPAGWRRLAVLLFGVPIEILIKIRQKGTGGFGSRAAHPPEIVRDKRRDTALVLLAQLGLVLLSWTTTGWWWGYAVVWILPLFGVAVLLNRCRIVVEHGLAHLIAWKLPGGFQEFGGLRIPTVDISPPAWEAALFAPYGFHHHCCHHLHMSVPHYNLPALRALLREHRASGFHEIGGSYLSALARCVHEAGDPPPRPDVT
jgi:fatty acid desaturase